MQKTILIAFVCSATTASIAILFAGRTVISSPFQLDIPYNSAVKVAQDPADVWSWHHDFQNVAYGTPQTVNVLVDIDGDSTMDTQHSWLRVIVTDLEIVSANSNEGIATISDGAGKRYSVGIGGSNLSGGLQASPVAHIALATPIVLPVGAPLHVTVADLNSTGDFEVNLIGRVVNL